MTLVGFGEQQLYLRQYKGDSLTIRTTAAVGGMTRDRTRIYTLFMTMGVYQCLELRGRVVPSPGNKDDPVAYGCWHRELPVY